MKHYVLTLLAIVLTLQVFGQDLYDTDHVTTIELSFETDDWDAQLDTYYANGLGESLPATCVLNGITYLSAGVSYSSLSYESEGLKNALTIQLDNGEGQSHQGYTTLELSNGVDDPAFVREVLGYAIARQYMDVPLANFATVYINGENYGVFSSVELINDAYQINRLNAGRENVRFKCGPDASASLNYLGSDSANYESVYALETAWGWTPLVQFVDDLEHELVNVENRLDVDRALWMLAFNNLTVNLASYTGPQSVNYYLILDNNGRFMPIPWNLGQGFGALANINAGEAITLTNLVELSPFLRMGEADYPLIAQLFSVPRYRKMYVAHYKTILEENFSNGAYYTAAQELQAAVLGAISAEPNGFYPVGDFTTNLNETVGDFPEDGTAGLRELMNARTTHLESLPELNYTAPEISGIDAPVVLAPYVTAVITATINAADFAFVAYRDDASAVFEQLPMADDGLHGDGVAGDGIYGAFVPTSAKDLQYYIYAENAEAGKFSPVRAAHEFYHIAVGGDVVINELMAQNNSAIADQDGEYDDWIELYNTTNEDIDLSGYYLTDQPDEMPLQWQFPEGTKIGANAYLLVWLDKDTLQEGLHANFKLKSSGETIAFMDPGGFEISKVEFPPLGNGITFGRYPSATGPFMRMFPTPEATNAYTALEVEEEKTIDWQLFPNPAQDYITLTFSTSNQYYVEIINLNGQSVYRGTIASGQWLDLTAFEKGMYLVHIPETGVTKRFIRY